MSGQINTANETTIISLLNELDVLSRTVQSLREKILKILPVKYGSSAWWKKENDEAINQIRAGEGIVIENQQELKKFFSPRKLILFSLVFLFALGIFLSPKSIDL